MRKGLLIGLVSVIFVILAVVFMGCGQSETATTTTAADTTTTTTTTSTTTSTSGATTTTTTTTTTTSSTTTTTTTSTTTTTAGVSVSAVRINGLAEASAVGAGVFRAQALLAEGTVSIKKLGPDGSTTQIASGEVELDGSYSVDIPIALITNESEEKNLIVEIITDSASVAAVIPWVSPEGGTQTYAPPANDANRVKKDILASAVASGMSKDANYLRNIESKLDDSALSDADEASIVALSQIVKDLVNDTSSISTSLGIPSDDLDVINESESTTSYRDNLVPIYQTAFETKTAPTSTQAASGLTDVEEETNTYLADDQGLSPQQVSDLTNLSNKWVASKIKTQLSGTDIYTNAKGKQLIQSARNYVLMLYECLEALNTVSSTTEASFEATYTASHEAALATKAGILAWINSQDPTGISVEALTNYINNNFFEMYMAPPISQELSLSNIRALSTEESTILYNQYVDNKTQGGQSWFVGNYLTLVGFISWQVVLEEISGAYNARTIALDSASDISSFTSALDSFTSSINTAQSSALTEFEDKFGSENALKAAKAFLLTTPIPETYIN